MSLLRSVQEEVLERLGRVEIAARQAVESLLQGQHRSIHHGLSVEFAGHRPYQPGDDLRHLDWFVWARTDRYDIRVYEEETHLRATIVVDCSGSMAYGSGRFTKLDYARMLAGALGLVMLQQSDAVGLALVDHEIREHHPPRGTMGNLLSIFERLEQTPAGGETSLAKVLDDLAERLSRRGLVILISDLFDDSDNLVRALQHLRHRKQDVRIFQVVDKEEETFPFKGTYEFVGLEREPSLKLDGDRVRQLYQETLAKHREKLAEGCHASSIGMETCRTDEDLAMVLVRALTGRWATGGASSGGVRK
jgi:uncharacterized protein (DUF58 family)